MNYFLLIFLSILSLSLYGDEKEELNALEVLDIQPWTNRVEWDAGYSYRTPQSLYTSIEELNFNYTHKWGTTTTLVLGFSGYRRDHGYGYLGRGALYQDLSDRVYTYVAVATGNKTFSKYLPRLRIDQDLYYKWGTCKNVVTSIGCSYFRYFDKHTDVTPSLGIQLYLDRWILGYKAFLNISNPGSKIGISNKFSFGYGAEKEAWTFLDVVFGRQSYLALLDDGDAPSPNLSINRLSKGFRLNHRHWMGPCWGLYGDLEYGWIESGYTLYKVLGGVFYEW